MARRFSILASSVSSLPIRAWYGWRDSGTAGSLNSTTCRSTTSGARIDPRTKTADAQPDFTRKPAPKVRDFATADSKTKNYKLKNEERMHASTLSHQLETLFFNF